MEAGYIAGLLGAVAPDAHPVRIQREGAAATLSIIVPGQLLLVAQFDNG